jgi:hypothetical protein
MSQVQPSDQAAQLARAKEEAESIARLRRPLLAGVVVLGAVLLLLASSEHFAIGRPFVILAIVWVGLWLPTVRVLAVEWSVRRRIDALQVVLPRARR